MERKLLNIPNIIIVIILLIVLFISFTSYNANKNEFFTISFYQSISLILVLIVSFILTQSLTDERKQKDIIDNVVSKIQDIVNDSKFHSQQTIEKKDILLLIKNLKGKISFLKESPKKFDINRIVLEMEKDKDDIDNLFNQFSGDQELLNTNRSQFVRVLNNIDLKCDQIRKIIFF